MADSIAETLLHTISTRNMGNPNWIKHVTDHRNWLEENSTPVQIPDLIFHTDWNRPLVALRKMDIELEDIFTVLLLNRVKFGDGLQEHHRVLLVPTEDALLTLKESYNATINS